MFVLNIRGLWFIAIIGGFLYWVAHGGPIPSAWSSTPPDDDEFVPYYVTLWTPLIKPHLLEYDNSDGISYSDPEYIGQRDLESEHGYDRDSEPESDY